jgi:hypothetical protein
MGYTLADNKCLDEFFGFLIHELLAVVVCLLVTLVIGLVIGLMALRLSASLYALLFRSLFSPVYWGAALLIGFWFNKRMRHYSACWVWVMPILAVGLLLMRYSVPAAEYYDQLLTCHDECLIAVFLTVPTLNCIAYSIGAWLALRSRKSPDASTLG